MSGAIADAGELTWLRTRAGDAGHTRAGTRMAALTAYLAVGPDDPEAPAWTARLTPAVQRATIDRHRTSQS